MLPHDPSIETLNQVLQNTQAGEKVIFTLSFKDSTKREPEELIEASNLFQTDLENIAHPYIQSIENTVDPSKEQDFITLAIQNLPLFLDKEDYKELERLIQPQQMQSHLAESKKLLLSPAGMITSEWLGHDPLGMMNFAFQKLKALNLNENYELYDGYIFNHQFRQLNFFLIPQYPSLETGKNKLLFEKVNLLLNQWETTHPDLKISYFGAAAVAAANADQMKKDTVLTLMITIILLLSLTYYVFRLKRATILLMIPVLFGAIFGLALTYLIQGSISILAVGCGAVILGIAIDFSVHFMSHARLHPSMEENVSNLAAPLTLGAFTTIAAFYALRFTSAPILQDLGLFASSSLLGASLFTLICLPHLIQQFGSSKKVKTRPNLIDKIASIQPEKKKGLLILVLLATPILFYFSGKVKFDADLMNLNYLSPELKEAQSQLNQDNSFALSSIYVVSQANSEEMAAQKMFEIQPLLQKLSGQKKIIQSLNPTTILPPISEQKKRIQRWESFWTEDKKAIVLQTLHVLGKENGFSPDAFLGFQNDLSKTYLPFKPSEIDFLKSLMPNSFIHKKGEYQFITVLKVNQDARTEIISDISSVPEVIVTDKQSVTEALLGKLSADFNQVVWMVGILVFFALLLAYGRIELALISFLPLALTWIWILGIMALLGLEFNIVNIVISTLIFGLGDDYSIFMMDGLMEKYKTGKNRITSTRSAVYLSVLTTVIGLGTLIFAQHPALRSIALISIIGLFCVVFISQVVQPFLFDILIQNRANKGFMPFTLWSLIKSIFSFFYFFLGCFLLSFLGFLLIKLKLLGKEKGKYYFHYAISKYTKSVLYIMRNFKKKLIVAQPDVFDKPAVYIANHSSFLDILATLMLNPKLILLTNNWVWHSPFFGNIVRRAEFYPVTDGAENSLIPLRKIVNEGYGIVVFPEGTRSKTGKIGRFKKGAFFIAEKLNLPIIPVFLHGFGYTIENGDWLLKDGDVAIHVGKPFDQELIGAVNYSERSKLARRWFQKEFQEQQKQLQPPRYFREQLIKNYIYKGPVLEWYCRIKLKLENDYLLFHELLPNKGFFYDLGCGYGFMTYMLHWCSEERTVYGIDYDEEKVLTAQNCYIRNKVHSSSKKSVQFEHANLQDVDLQPCEGIIISDVLHYLIPKEQMKLLEKCYKALKPGGILIVRDGDSTLTARHEGTKLTEIFSTKIFRFNKTQNALYFLNQNELKNWASKHRMEFQILDRSRKTSNLIFEFRKSSIPKVAEIDK